MSWFNFGSGHNTGLSITTSFADTRYAHDDVHDAELGRSVRFHTPFQREYYLKRHPEMVGKLRPVADPNRIPTWDDASTVDGMPASLQKKYALLAEQAALLKDPIALVQRRLPTKPVANPEPAISLYRSSIHECGHVLACFAFDVAIARMSLIKDGDKLGHIKHADLPDSEKHLAILLGGRAAEIVEFGNERLAGSQGDMQNARAMAKRLAGDGAEALIEQTLARNVEMLRGIKTVVRSLAYDLIRQKEIDFEAVDAAIDRAFSRSEQEAAAKIVPTKGRVVRTWDFSNPKDVADWCKRNGLKQGTEPMGHADGYFVRTKR